MRKFFLLVTLLGLSWYVGGLASAGPLTGQQMEIQVFFNGSEFDPANLTRVFTVDPTFPTSTVEFPLYAGADSLAIDLGDTGPASASVLITANSSVPFGSSSDGQNLIVFTAVSSAIPTFTDTDVVLGE